MGTPVFAQSPSNIFSYPGFSFGWTDNSSAEFMAVPIPNYFVEIIDQLNLSSHTLPAFLGIGFVQNFGFNFHIDPANPFWLNMELIIKVSNVIMPGQMIIQVPGCSIPASTVNINGPGQYIVPLGDFSLIGTSGFISMSTMTGLKFGFDSLGLRSAVDVPPPLTTSWLGFVSTDWQDPANWSNGVPGMFHDVTKCPERSSR